VRAHHPHAPATLWPRDDGSVEVRFDAPQTAIAPGQLCVFYDGERVMGGANIAHALDGDGVSPESALSPESARLAGAAPAVVSPSLAG